MDSTNCRISRRRMPLAGKRWILWQSGEINRSTCVICIVVWEIFEGAPTGLLVPRWRSTGVWRTSRCGTRSCRSPSWNRCHLDCLLPDLTWLDSYPDHLLQITSCRLFKEGNLVSWLGDTWHLNSSRGTVSHPSRICILWVTILLIWS